MYQYTARYALVNPLVCLAMLTRGCARMHSVPCIGTCTHLDKHIFNFSLEPNFSIRFFVKFKSSERASFFRDQLAGFFASIAGFFFTINMS